ncbi:TonB family protein [Kistimonas scapharcae]
MAQATAPVTTADRLSFTLLLAVALHALIILGVGFTLHDNPEPAKTIEVTLASFQSEKAPEKADYLAQVNQEGSGSLEEAARPSSDQLQAPVQDNEIRKVELREQTEQQQRQTLDTSRKVTAAVSNQRIKEGAGKQKESPIRENNTPRPKIDLRAEIASLEAEFYEQRNAYAKRPRILRLNAASTRQSDGVWYMEAWRKKVMRIGNINYPESARSKKLYGQLELAVQINRDGTLNKIEVLRSSGHKVLDDAAIRIVELAAPFAPFPDDLREKDIIEIIRTWRFEPGDRIYSG